MKPSTQSWVAREECGCITGVLTGLPPKETAKEVAKWIREERVVSSHTVDEVKKMLRDEASAFKCPHKKAAR